MKTLKIIQTLSGIGKILSKIVFICCIIGAAGCAVGMISIPIADTGIFKIGGLSIYSVIVNRADIDLNSLYPLLIGMMIFCIGQAVTAEFAKRYFQNELVEGTPFTLNGAKELLRLGILTICVPLGALISAQIISSIVAEFIGSKMAFNPDGGDSVALGVMFIFSSLLCQYGAEMKENQCSEEAES